MKAIVKVISNIEEIREAERKKLALGIEAAPPEPEYIEVPFYFSMDFVGYAYNYPEDQIVARIYGNDINLIYTDELWDAFTNYLERKR